MDVSLQRSEEEYPYFEAINILLLRSPDPFTLTCSYRANSRINSLMRAK